MVLAIHILNESITKKQAMVPNKQQLRAACLINKLKFKYSFMFKPYNGRNTLEHLAINQMKEMNTQTAFNHVYCHKI